MRDFVLVKHCILKYGYVLLLAALCACSNSEEFLSSGLEGVVLSADSLSGLVRVNAAGNSFYLGSNESGARANERPAMKVKLDYVFSMGRHEVTCGEFDSLMAPGLALACDKDLPATNVTYYDAVLYANARSKAEGFDTAYTYSSAVFDDGGHCVNLEGYAFHPEAAAYRLPTEAEWVLVAKMSWNLEKGWTAGNSEYRLHEVCGLAGEDKFCDLVGNAMEWVNDWLGNFRDTTVENYVGAPDGGGLGQRVVKGGSYRNDAGNITLYGRGDVYTVTSSTRADYVGFRLAFGPIPGAVWMGNDGKANSTRIVPLANSSTLRSRTGTYRVKLAFRNDVTGNLAYVDYSSGVLSVVEIADTLEVYHPEISPDGRHVAFCTVNEGVSGQSSLYVRDLEASGSNLVRLDVESAAVPRWRVLENGDTAIVYVTDAGNNKDEATFKSASTWQVTFSGGKFGTPKKLFDGAYHGGVSADDRLAVTGARLLRARVAEPGSTLEQSARDTVWYNGEQACNVSLSKDGSDRTLFLDFGGKTGRDFAGEKYGTHERLLVADSTGKLVQSVGAPSGYSFDHSEWAGNRNLVVATLANANGAHQKIVLVDLSDSSVVELAEGDELWHPNLWIRENIGIGEDVLLDLDSAGVYLSEDHTVEQARFRLKMERYWKILDSIHVFLAGSSRMEMGVNPDLYPEWKMFNLGVSGIDPKRDFYFVKNYVLNHSQNIKAIVLSIDLDNWRGVEKHLASVMLAGIGYQYDANHGFWKDGLPNGFIEAVKNGYPAETYEEESFSARGGLVPPSRGWDADGFGVMLDSVYTDDEIAFLDECLDDLRDIAAQAAEKNIYVIGILFPQSPRFKETGALGLYGLQRSVAQKKIDDLYLLSKMQKNFIFMDENKMGDHDYTDEMAQNRDHLSYLGAQKLTARLDSVLKSIEWE